MSASVETSAIFMKDEPSRIKNKINKYAFSGGQVSVAEQREKGGDPTVDVSYQYLTFFLEDDEELEKIRVAYQKGELLTGELKAKCIEELQLYVKGFQERRAKVDEAVVDEFMKIKPLEYKGNPNPIKTLEVRPKEGEAEGAAPGGMTKNQLKKLEKEKMIAAKKAAKAQA